jgi:glucosamine--fructose-6-phosphate aminotransferase (isomerizing)
MRTEPVVSSEFQNVLDFIDKDSVILAISQSGETADVLNSVKHAKEVGAKILSIVNISTSSLARISDSFLTVNCGPEVGVAATKSFTGQLSVIYTIIDKLCNGSIGVVSKKQDITSAIESILSSEEQTIRIADLLKDSRDVYILGKSLHYPIALEGALKIKELTYNSIVIVINPSDITFKDVLSNAHEIKSRGATIIGISNELEDVYDHFIKLPVLDSILYPIIEIIPLQLLAYHLALKKNADPDYPRNLAKSVTVK